MASLCVKCDLVVRPRQHALQCDDCDKWQHRICDTGISQQVYRRLMRGEDLIGHWLCYACKTAEHVDVNSELDHSGDPAVNVDIPVRPDPFEESVIDDVEARDIPDSPDKYTLLENGSIRGNPKLYQGGFEYCFKRKTSCSTTWRCAKRKLHTCKAEVKEVKGTYTPVHSITVRPCGAMHKTLAYRRLTKKTLAPTGLSVVSLPLHSYQQAT